MTYSISLQRVEPRPFAAVRQSMHIREVPSRFRPFLDQVYAAAKTGAISLDGQNIFVYRAATMDFLGPLTKPEQIKGAQT